MPIAESSLTNALATKVNLGAGGGPIESRGAMIDPLYVDKNVRSSGDGFSWDEAYKTYAEAAAANNAIMGLSANRFWAKRGTIYFCADGETESMVLFAERCDLKGVGSDATPWPKLTGTHTFAAADTGVRIMNMGLIAGGTTAPIMTVPTGTHGIQILGCRFYKAEGSLPTSGVSITNSADVGFFGNYIYPDVGGVFCTLGLSIAGASASRMEIARNQIWGGVAFKAASSVTGAKGATLHDNLLVATTECIDDDSNLFTYWGNNGVSAAALGSNVDWNAALAGINHMTGNSLLRIEPSCDQEY